MATAWSRTARGIPRSSFQSRPTGPWLSTSRLREVRARGHCAGGKVAGARGSAGGRLFVLGRMCGLRKARRSRMLAASIVHSAPAARWYATGVRALKRTACRDSGPCSIRVRAYSEPAFATAVFLFGCARFPSTRSRATRAAANASFPLERCGRRGHRPRLFFHAITAPVPERTPNEPAVYGGLALRLRRAHARRAAKAREAGGFQSITNAERCRPQVQQAP